MKKLKFTFKSVFFIFITLIILLIMPQTIYADTSYTSGDYTYVLSGSNATITGYNGTGGNIAIPAELDGYKVTGIGQAAFSNCTNVTSLMNVTIPNSVTSIGSEAFLSCGYLTSVNIPGSVTSISNGAFRFCYNLISVTIGEGVTSIDSDAFYHCGNLTSVTIPNSVTSIGAFAFDSCTKLASLTIGNGVSSIDSNAFSNCTKLTNVTIPESVKIINNNTFSKCTSLTYVQFLGDAPPTAYGVFQDCPNTLVIYYICGKTGFTNPWQGFRTMKSGIEVTAQPTKTDYVVGQSLDLTGLIVTRYYYDGTTEIMPITMLNISGFDSSVPAIGQVVTVTDNGEIATFTIDILPKTYIITFNSNGGSTIASQIVYDNTAIIAPFEPTKPGYTFGGWYKEAECINVWDFTTDKVTSDTTLYAKWTAKPVTGITLDKTIAGLKVGNSINLIATLSPTDVANNNVTWSSSNTSVATVDNAGKVTAFGKGTATIIVITADGGHTASCTVTVSSNEKPVISGAADKTVMIGDSFDVSGGVTATDAEDGNLTADIMVTGSVDIGRVGNYTVTYDVTDKDGNKVSKSITINVVSRNIQVLSLIGSDRYDTAVKLSQSQFSTADTIIIVNGEAMADGLGATPLAKFKNAPLLLTETKALPDVTISEISRLRAKNAFIVGGTGVVSDEVKKQLQALGLTVERISGSDRYGTSLEVAKYIDKNCYDVSTIVVSNGYGEADALSIASVAGRDNMPIILAEKDNIPAATYDWLKSENIENAYIIGGTGVVSNNVLDKIDAITSGDIINNRLGGQNRFETNSLVIDKFYGSVIDKTYIAKGYELIDALAAGSVAAINGSPVVLTDMDLTTSQKTVLDKRYRNIIIRTGGGISDTAVNSFINCL